MEPMTRRLAEHTWTASPKELRIARTVVLNLKTGEIKRFSLAATHQVLRISFGLVPGFICLYYYRQKRFVNKFWWLGEFAQAANGKIFNPYGALRVRSGTPALLRRRNVRRKLGIPF
jgi:hypothetical protein